MRKAVLATVLLAFAAAPVLVAQSTGAPGGHKPNIATMVQRQVNHLTLLLDLTPDQQTSLTTLLTNNATANQPLMSSMRAAQKALHTAETNNDSAGIQSASAQIGTTTGQLTASRSTLNAGIAQILTATQLAKYKALGHGGPGRGGRGRGPGGFGGPGPGGPGPQ